MRQLYLSLTMLVAVALVLLSVPACNSDQKPTFTLRPTPTLSPAETGATNVPVETTDSSSSGNAALAETSQSEDPQPTPDSQSAAAPLTATPVVPSPTVVPIWVWLGADVPSALVRATADGIAAQPDRLALTDDRSLADVQIGGGITDGIPVATWVFAVVAPFPTLADDVPWQALSDTWAGIPAGPFAGQPLLMTAETLALMQTVLGAPASGVVVTVPEPDLLGRAWAQQPAWAIVPFEALDPRWKVLCVDGVSPLDRGLDLGNYPLVAHISATGPSEALESVLATAALPATNRDENRMTVVVMTGVTALTRATAWRMEQKGLTYPAQDIGDWLRNADITHVSNEVSFDPECGPPNPVQEGLLFCSDPRYIELLEDIGVDVVEMTGNHIADAGVEHVEPTLDMYVERGWKYFGGGRNLEDSHQPAIFEHNGNVIAFLGCNPVGPASVWATAEQAGAAPCDYESLYAQIRELRSRGVLPIVTLQYWEMDRYDPTPQQIEDFQALVDAGAVIASGSHAHHAQSFGFHEGGFIHFGVGNLFFDQMELLGNRQEFIDRHIFYAGRHISTEVLTAMLEDWSRPRPMTEQERRELLQTVFSVSQWD